MGVKGPPSVYEASTWWLVAELPEVQTRLALWCDACHEDGPHLNAVARVRVEHGALFALDGLSCAVCAKRVVVPVLEINAGCV